MLDQIRFMEMLRDITQIAETQGHMLSQDEIREYFKDTGLSEEQLVSVYQYLAEKQIRVQGYQAPLKKGEQEEEEKGSSPCASMYLKEIEGLRAMGEAEEWELYAEVSSGKEGARERLIEGWLPRIPELAKNYRNRGVLMEDLIQQGNMGLIMGVDSLRGRAGIQLFPQYLEEYIQNTMELYIDENMESDDRTNAVVGKINLLHEAARILSEDFGRTPTRLELAEYTHMGLKEIEDILGLTKEF